MRAVPAARAIPLLLSALVLGGCMLQAYNLDLTRHNIELQVPGARFEPEFQLTLGRISLGLARKIVSMVDDEDTEELAVLRDIKRLELAIYKTEVLPSIDSADFEIPKIRHLKKKGWMTATEVLSDDGVTWVLFRRQGERIKGLMVGALDDDELVLVKLNGDIQNIFDRLMEEGILDVPGVVQADLEPEPGEPIAIVDSEIDSK